MKIIIFGSRHLNPSIDVLHSIIVNNQVNITQIIDGGCRGIDQLGKEYGLIHKIPVTTVAAEWNRYGRSAGPIRNAKMVELADMGICIWDGKSKGTLDTINKLKATGKPVIVHIV